MYIIYIFSLKIYIKIYISIYAYILILLLFQIPKKQYGFYGNNKNISICDRNNGRNTIRTLVDAFTNLTILFTSISRIYNLLNTFLKNVNVIVHTVTKNLKGINWLSIFFVNVHIY